MEAGGVSDSHGEGRFMAINCQELVCVEYPAIIKNVNNMIDTLGGMDVISEIYNDPRERLQLKYRPRDPSCKPVFAQLHKSKGLLMRVTRKRKKRDTNGQPGPWQYEQKILGIVVDVYRFDAMMDFQYLTPPSIQSPYKQLFGRDLLSRDEPFFPIPKFFTRIDTPGNYFFRGFSAEPTVLDQDNNSDTTGQDGKSNSDTLRRKQRQGYGLAALYKSKVIPSEPILENKKKCDQFLQQFPVNQKNVDELKRLFEERPLWQRGALLARSKMRKEFFKQFLPCVAYYWINGPWGRLWCKLGYDPRLHPECFKYQPVECRIKDTVERIMTLKRKHRKQPKVPLATDRPESGLSTPKRRVVSGKDETEFHNVKAPSSRQTRYQLCDIFMPEVQEIVRGIRVDKDSKCTEQDGFLPDGMMNKFREILRARILELMTEEAEKVAASSSTEHSNPKVDDANAMDVGIDQG